MRADYCPLGGEPCQSLCETPCTTTSEVQRLRSLARDAYEAWDNDRDAKVGKLLRAMLDDAFCKTYRPDLAPNASGKGPAAAG